jgi:hypothetical protein
LSKDLAEDLTQNGADAARFYRRLMSGDPMAEGAASAVLCETCEGEGVTRCRICAGSGLDAEMAAQFRRKYENSGP